MPDVKTEPGYLKTYADGLRNSYQQGIEHAIKMIEFNRPLSKEKDFLDSIITQLKNLIS